MGGLCSGAHIWLRVEVCGGFTVGSYVNLVVAGGKGVVRSAGLLV